MTGQRSPPRISKLIDPKQSIQYYEYVSNNQHNTTQFTNICPKRELNPRLCVSLYNCVSAGRQARRPRVT